MKILFAFLLLIVTVIAAPWIEILFGDQSGYNYRPPNQGKQEFKRRQGKGGKERWKEICRTINPDPFAFTGRGSYPVAPICPW